MVLGGESIFLDGFCIAEEFREKFPNHFETLTRVPATFQKFHFERYVIKGISKYCIYTESSYLL